MQLILTIAMRGMSPRWGFMRLGDWLPRPALAGARFDLGYRMTARWASGRHDRPEQVADREAEHGELFSGPA
jgi:hypothetical protein